MVLCTLTWPSLNKMGYYEIFYIQLYLCEVIHVKISMIPQEQKQIIWCPDHPSIFY